MSKRNFFSQLAKDIILEVVNKYRDILECKKTDFRSIKSKNDTWEKVTKEFNVQSGVTKYPRIMNRSCPSSNNVCKF